MALFCPAAKECDEAIIVSFSCACREAHCRPAITPGRVADFSLRFERFVGNVATCFMVDYPDLGVGTELDDRQR
ncbi:unnamed protein product [Nippostrongylus brasiliensis]|uniref:Phlebovirus glycoprotein G2 fusion domain-containing protein n=1 Tax=Nippostrongylus brasiliensis TaxID=27835 RepID=A0A0N4YTX8_NIPBR|nr:unnamed protein product [Nippostrongylus brasiliensis]